MGFIIGGHNGSGVHVKRSAWQGEGVNALVRHNVEVERIVGIRLMHGSVQAAAQVGDVARQDLVIYDPYLLFNLPGGFAAKFYVLILAERVPAGLQLGPGGQVRCKQEQGQC